MSSKKPVVLVIRDGWGRNPLGPDVAKEYGDATVLADTPFTDYLLANYPHSLLGASGEDVGLPDGQMGNSEVGHLNLGAGRVVFQDLCRVDNAIKDGSMGENSVLKTAFSQAAGLPPAPARPGERRRRAQPYQPFGRHRQIRL